MSAELIAKRNLKFFNDGKPVKGLTLDKARDGFEEALGEADKDHEIIELYKSNFSFVTAQHLNFLQENGGNEKLRGLYYQVILFDLMHNTKTSHFLTAEHLKELADEQIKNPSKEEKKFFSNPETVNHTVRHRSSETSSITSALDIMQQFIQEKGFNGAATFIDIGSGSGKPILIAMGYNRYRGLFNKACGIDNFLPMKSIAEENLAKTNIGIDKNKVSFIFEDACKFKDYNGTNAVLMYNPFDADSVEKIEKKIRKFAGRTILGYIKPKYPEAFLQEENGWSIHNQTNNEDPDKNILIVTRDFD
ncbi:MAG: hypothetical protein WBK77_10865 [Alphaproteobacteria bacterium]